MTRHKCAQPECDKQVFSRFCAEHLLIHRPELDPPVGERFTPDEEYAANKACVHIERLDDGMLYVAVGSKTFFFSSNTKIHWDDQSEEFQA